MHAFGSKLSALALSHSRTRLVCDELVELERDADERRVRHGDIAASCVGHERSTVRTEKLGVDETSGDPVAARTRVPYAARGDPHRSASRRASGSDRGACHVVGATVPKTCATTTDLTTWNALYWTQDP
jgi:hypothetical protein